MGVGAEGSLYIQCSSVQLLSCVRLFVTPWTAARQASLSITNSRSLPNLMSIESAMPSNHLILYMPIQNKKIFKITLPPKLYQDGISMWEGNEGEQPDWNSWFLLEGA